MLDVKYVREHPQELKESVSVRNLSGPQFDVGDFLRIDEKKRSVLQELEGLRALRNKLSDITGKPSQDVINKVKETKEQIKILEDQLKELEVKWQWHMDWFPNIPHPSMPVGKDDSGNVEFKISGEKKTHPFPSKHHADLGAELNLIDTKKAGEVAGSRFFYLKNEAVLLQWAIFSLALEKLQSRGFSLINPPVILKQRALYGTGYFPSESSQIYELSQGEKFEDADRRFLVGTSEQALVGYHMDDILELSDELPIRYGGISTCFRSEAGSWGKDTRGIKRVHQFDKVELIYFTTPETSQKYMLEAMEIETEILSDLGLTWRVMDMCTGDVGLATHRKFDVEVWMLHEQAWMETHSNSDLASFHCRRLNIRYRKQDGSLEYPHTISATCITNSRPIAAIIDNFQQPDGSIVVPEVLKKYMNGLEVIKPK